ncbi:MAG: enterobactin exporter EntS [Chloroflexota bacterium]|jgi:MFS family permease
MSGPGAVGSGAVGSGAGEPGAVGSGADVAATPARRRAGALRHRNFRLFFVGQLVSLAGTWMQTLAQSWLVLTLERDPFWLGVVGAAQFGPVLVVGLFGGVLADLLPKRRTIVATQAAQMALAFVLGALTWLGVVELGHVIVLALLLGIVNAIDMPARQSFLIEMVGREDVASAVGLNAASFNVTRIVGPAIGGVVIGAVGIAACFALNGLSFLAVLAGLLLMRDEELRLADRLERPGSAREVAGHLAEGLRYVVGTPLVRLALVMIAIVSTVGMNFGVAIPALADAVLGVGATGLGFLMAAMGLGSTAAALVFAIGGPTRPRPWAIVLGALGVGATQLVTGLAPSYPLALAMLAGLGAASIGMMISANTAIQLSVPDRLRGRAIAVYTTILAGTTPIGSLAIGAIASRLGTEVAWVVAGSLSLVAGLGGAVWLRLRGVSGPGAPPPGS